MGSRVERYTSLQADISTGGNDYTAKPIQRGELVYENLNNKATIRLDKTLFPADVFSKI